MQKILLLDRSYTERGRRRMGFLLVKRTFDVLASFCMLLVLLPLGLLVALTTCFYGVLPGPLLKKYPAEMVCASRSSFGSGV